MVHRTPCQLPDKIWYTGLPVRYLIRYGTQEMFTFLEVNGAATDASAIDKEIPGIKIEFEMKI